jgi:predicted mannosyl-3-phosphoglycerate phosphatase (HAD superfamily)
MNDTARQAEITVGELDAILQEVDRLETIMQTEFERLRVIEAAAKVVALWAGVLDELWGEDAPLADTSETAEHLGEAISALRAALASSPVLPDQGEGT